MGRRRYSSHDHRQCPACTHSLGVHVARDGRLVCVVCQRTALSSGAPYEHCGSPQEPGATARP